MRGWDSDAVGKWLDDGAFVTDADVSLGGAVSISILVVFCALGRAGFSISTYLEVGLAELLVEFLSEVAENELADAVDLVHAEAHHMPQVGEMYFT